MRVVDTFLGGSSGALGLATPSGPETVGAGKDVRGRERRPGRVRRVNLETGTLT